MRPIIKTEKHYVQVSLSTIATGVVLGTDIISAVAAPGATSTSEVEQGAIVKAVYLEMWVIGAVSNQFFTAILHKLPSGIATPSAANMAALGNYASKKDILYTTQGLASNDGIAGPIPIIRQWFKIPRGKQRFGLLDKLKFTIMSRGSDDLIICGFATFKEQT